MSGFSLPASVAVLVLLRFLSIRLSVRDVVWLVFCILCFYCGWRRGRGECFCMIRGREGEREGEREEGRKGRKG
ncbi:hypothetical protein EYC80_002319 [Monilinia laxa]|uniref:Uncharacterized protein n=1 Tax=Monilinia laxa TaxID=61186 RepID=A0A5N6K3J4_MONLA|nr:hypothetical protein EYC80_002319 [Monilinia laxa]